MIQVNNELCYSPHPPEYYAVGGYGHGPLCRGDIQLWNLIYLSHGGLDMYGLDYSLADIMGAIPFSVAGSAVALLNDERCKRFFPHARYSLRQSPRKFFDALCTMNIKSLPQSLMIPNWLDTVTERVLMCDPAPRPLEFLTHSEGNILHVKFGRK